MLKNLKQYLIIAGIIVAILAFTFFGGCQYGRKRVKCPEISTDVIIIHDTVTHLIADTIPFYIIKRDSIVYFDTIHAPVDTALILADYFAVHYYTRRWQDSLLIATSEDAISENRFIDNKFSYKYIGPIAHIQNVQDKTVTWNKYIYAGIDLPLKNFNYISLEGIYAFPKGYVGVSWRPELKGVGIKAGVKLLKFKK